MAADEQESPHHTKDEMIEEILKRPSSLPQIAATMRGFSTEEEARKLGDTVFTFLKAFGTYLDLERLEAVTIAFDYADALAEIDRGSFKQVLTPTHDELAVGVAIAAPVLRDGKPYSHLVLNAGVVSFLRIPEDPNFNLALHILAHEAVHVHDLLYQDRAYPGVFGQPIRDMRDSVLFEIARICWEEYIASLKSASYAPMNQTANFEETFCSALRGVRERGNTSIRQFRYHGDVTRLIRELSRDYGNALRYGAYLLGHVEGLGKTLEEAAPRATATVRSLSWFSALFERFSANLKTMYEAYGRWSGLKVFEPLQGTVHDVLKAAGVEFQPRPSGQYYLNVPFTPETTPT